jgi:hypothetical protein
MEVKAEKTDKTFIRHLLAVLLVCGMLVAGSTRAEAQCEFAVTIPAATGVAAANVAAIEGATIALMAVYTLEITAVQATLITLMELMEQAILDRMNQFWEDWEEALQGMTAQIHAGINDQTRQMSSMFDTSNLTDMARTIQRQEDRAKKQFTPSEQGCRFDTTAVYRAQARRTTAHYQNLMVKEVVDVGTNKAGSLGSTGTGELLSERWSRYENAFCDPDSNSGNAPCTGAMPDRNANITPSRTIFAQETIDVSNPNNYLAANEIMYNITGFEPPPPVDSLNQPQGKEARQRSRNYLAQMDVATALVSSVIAERMPGEEAPSVAAIRSSVGVPTPSDRPSEREIRQATIEQFFDPNYYINLIDNPSVVAREETFLYAYNLMLLYKLIEKTEKIANGYAVQTANILQQADTATRSGVEKFAPTR